ncbi:hypothetical protein [Motilibacter aurantiacus]|uniref:hypothetical protein n=1 Tax=Motilibacter aurantiacus TaxID=2714955 RepID=UPI00140CBA83|nr:hypothetical protein [Motilibacter aurantiacus]NHC45368.1 hypothetical protein [Motilibacter aurantiacus]
MSSRVPLDALFAGYVHDLAQLAELARDEHAEGLRGSRALVGKLALEAVRVSVYERHFLLPVVRESLSDGDHHARTVTARLDALEQRVVALEGLDPESEAAGVALRALTDTTVDLANEQRSGLLPALAEAVGDRELVFLAERVVPTQQAGTTHSHPKLPQQYDLQHWPQRGLARAAREALEQEARIREADFTSTS